MKKIFTILIIVLFVLNIAKAQKSNKELIIGTWKYVSIIQENDNKELKGVEAFDFNKISFGTDKRYRSFKDEKEIDKSDIIEYRLINATDLIDYPNFKKEDDNGNIIALVFFERDGSLYKGTNIDGPYKIIKIDENKIILKSLTQRFKIEREKEEITEDIKNMINQLDNILIVFERVNNDN